MIADKFRGLGTALVTPFKVDGSIDEYGLEKLVTLQIEGGVDFLVPCGTTGENPALSMTEHSRVVELVIRRANGKVPVLAGAGSNSTDKAVDLALAARSRRSTTSPTPTVCCVISRCRPTRSRTCR